MNTKSLTRFLPGLCPLWQTSFLACDHGIRFYATEPVQSVSTQPSKNLKVLLGSNASPLQNKRIYSFYYDITSLCTRSLFTAKATEVTERESIEISLPTSLTELDAWDVPRTLLDSWQFFLKVLYQLGYFEVGSGPLEMAIQQVHDVKAALTNFGTNRPDILLSLPIAHLRALAEVDVVVRKSRLKGAERRLRNTYIVGVLRSSASHATLQDVITLVEDWAATPQDQVDKVAPGLVPVLRQLMIAMLRGAMTPADPLRHQQASQLAMGVRGSWDAIKDANNIPDTADKRDMKLEALHQNRLAIAAAQGLAIAVGDWFCGLCSRCNRKGKDYCFGCGARPGFNSSDVTEADVRALYGRYPPRAGRAAFKLYEEDYDEVGRPKSMEIKPRETGMDRYLLGKIEKRDGDRGELDDDDDDKKFRKGRQRLLTLNVKGKRKGDDEDGDDDDEADEDPRARGMRGRPIRRKGRFDEDGDEDDVSRLGSRAAPPWANERNPRGMQDSFRGKSSKRMEMDDDEEEEERGPPRSSGSVRGSLFPQSRDRTRPEAGGTRGGRSYEAAPSARDGPNRGRPAQSQRQSLEEEGYDEDDEEDSRYKGRKGGQSAVGQRKAAPVPGWVEEKEDAEEASAGLRRGRGNAGERFADFGRMNDKAMMKDVEEMQFAAVMRTRRELEDEAYRANVTTRPLMDGDDEDRRRGRAPPSQRSQPPAASAAPLEKRTRISEYDEVDQKLFTFSRGSLFEKSSSEKSKPRIAEVEPDYAGGMSERTGARAATNWRDERANSSGARSRGSAEQSRTRMDDYESGNVGSRSERHGARAAVSGREEPSERQRGRMGMQDEDGGREKDSDFEAPRPVSRKPGSAKSSRW